MIKKVPNILCVIRVILIPFVLLFMLGIPSSVMSENIRFLIAGIIFGVAIITDVIDGKIARKYDAVTNFGKFLDPIADKLLVLSVLMALVDRGLLSAIPVIIIMAREFMVTGLRLGAMDKGTVVAANIWGKIKTVSQGIAIGIYFVFVAFLPHYLFFIPRILMWLVTVYTVISVIPYFLTYKDFLKD